MKEGRSAYIKSNNPHLTGGEKGLGIPNWKKDEEETPSHEGNFPHFLFALMAKAAAPVATTAPAAKTTVPKK